MKIKYLLCLTSVLLIMAECKRDLVPPVLQCERGYSEDDFKDCSILSYNFDNWVKSPTSNPNNTAEFVYIDKKGDLIKFNTDSKEKQTLVDNLDRILTPDWGENGWIVFSAGWKIWKVKEDGSELTQLTEGCRDLNPVFNTLGNKISYSHDPCYSQSSGEARLDYKIHIIDVEGNQLDSFCRPFENDPCYPWDVVVWFADDKYVATAGPNNDLSNYGLSIYDDNGTETKRIYNVKDKNYKVYPFIHDIEYHSTNDLIYFQDARGIKTLDSNNGKVRLLKKSCTDEFYESFTITSGGNHLIAVKGEAWKDEENCAVEGEYYFVKMKCDGSDEERIDIPQ